MALPRIDVVVFCFVFCLLFLFSIEGAPKRLSSLATRDPLPKNIGLVKGSATGFGTGSSPKTLSGRIRLIFPLKPEVK